MAKKNRMLFVKSIAMLILFAYSCGQPTSSQSNNEPPAAPTNLTITANTESSISLSWTDNSDNEQGFTLERADSGDFSRAVGIDIAENTTSYIDRVLNQDTAYYYRIAAYNDEGNSFWSNAVDIKLGTANEIQLQVDFIDGEYWTYTKIYTIWIENQTTDFIQNLYVCTHANAQDLTGTALPYWELNKRLISDADEVDAVTGATQKRTDFTVTRALKEAQTKFTVYFEVDHYYDPNDWFNEQPAILYAADVDLDNPKNAYTLEFIGWTPNEITEDIIPNTPLGVFQDETRYITHTNDNGAFGIIDDRKAIDMVGSITLAIIR